MKSQKFTYFLVSYKILQLLKLFGAIIWFFTTINPNIYNLIYDFQKSQRGCGILINNSCRSHEILTLTDEMKKMMK